MIIRRGEPLAHLTPGLFHKLPPSTHCSYHLKNLHHPAIYILLTARYYNFPKHKRVWDILLQLKFSCQLFHGPLSITGWVKWITLYIFVVTWPIWSRLPRNKGWLNFPTSSNHSALPHSLLWYVNHCNFENESGIYLRDEGFICHCRNIWGMSVCPLSSKNNKLLFSFWMDYM